MKHIVAGHEAFDAFEFTELALGVDRELRELFAGMPNESEQDRAVRLDAARDVLADLSEDDPELAAYATILLRSAPVPLRRPTATPRRRSYGAGVAA